MGQGTARPGLKPPVGTGSRRRGRARALAAASAAAAAAAFGLVAVLAPAGGAPSLAALGQTVSVKATEGQVFSGQVAALGIDCAAGAATGVATVSWGDGSSSPAQFAQRSAVEADVSGTHVYAEEGVADATVAGYWSCDGARHSFSSAFGVQVADAALSASGLAVAATSGLAFSGAVATFADADPAGSPGDYSATVDWGDGTRGAGAVAPGPTGAGFDVSGVHTYAAPGAFTVTVTVADAGGSQATAQTRMAVAPAPAPPTVGLRLPTGAVSGKPVTLDATGVHTGAAPVTGLYWTVDGHQLANCAGATSEVLTGALPAGTDTIGLRVVTASGTTRTLSGSVTVPPAPRGAMAPGARRVRTAHLPMVADCVRGPGDPADAGVAPAVPGAPGAGCTMQVQSGIVDAVGCMTEHQDTLDVLGSVITAGYKSFTSYATVVAGPGGLPAKPGSDLPGVASSADSQTIVSEVGEQLSKQLGANGGTGSVCTYLEQLLSEALADGDQQQAQEWREELQQDLCTGIPDGNQQTPNGVEGGPGASSLGGAHAPLRRTGSLRRGDARLLHVVPGRTVAQVVGDGCSADPAPDGSTYGGATVSTVCLDLFVATGSVRLNGVDYQPPSGGELVIAPQFDLVVSQSVSSSLDGLLLDPSHPYQAVNYLLPASAQSGQASDFPALSVQDLSQTIADQPQSGAQAASQVADELSKVGGFASAGGLEVGFEDGTAIIDFQVQLPSPFTGDGGPVTAKVVARVGATEPFHVVYGYLGSTSGGAGVGLGPFQLQDFGICYRARYSTDADTAPGNPDPYVDPCRQVTGIDDSAMGDGTWLASGELAISGAVDVAFRPGADFSSTGCSKLVRLGFAFSAGRLTQAGAFVDVSDGGVPLVPGIVALTGFGGSFSEGTDPGTGGRYETFAGCLSFDVVKILHVTATLFGVETSGGYRYSFSHGELAPCTLPEYGGTYPYTEHLALGACGTVSLSLPGLPSLPLANGYALYVDDSGGSQHAGAVFFGGGICFSVPTPAGHDCHNPPGTAIALGAEVNGAIGLGAGTPFDFEGEADVTARFAGFTVLAGQAEALVSSGPAGTGGIGVCGDVSLFNGALEASGGFAYPWKDDVGGFLSNALLKHQGIVFSTNPSEPACDLTWLDNQVGVDVQALPGEGRLAPAGAAVAGRDRVTLDLPGGARVLDIDLKGVGGAPDVTVTAPDGAAASTASVPAGRPVRTASFTLVRVPQLEETFIAANHPLAGRYVIRTVAGSPALARATPVEGVVTAVRATVTGHGQQRHLVYSFHPRSGETVLFYQRSAQVDTLIGSATTGHGSIPFVATAGSGRRQVVAEVCFDGAPQERVVVGDYQAPGLRSLGRARRLRVSRHGGLVTVAFSRVPGAGRYGVYVALSNGARLALVTRARRAVFGPVFLDAGGTVTVRALGDGVYSANGPAVTRRFAPVVRTVLRPVHRGRPGAR